MADDVTLDQLAEDIALKTEALAQAAANDSLEKFKEVMRARDDLVLRLETEALSVQDPQKVRHVLTKARDLNNSLVEQLEKDQKQLLDTKSKLMTGRQMQQAYSENK
ncbi:MAG: hypothetical protein HWE12_06725 [Oceanospirillaceae bacterium]|nr:hypothetical protein [Oceanospirillaceae bacterium]